jgi:hypothetical protein
MMAYILFLIGTASMLGIENAIEFFAVLGIGFIMIIIMLLLALGIRIMLRGKDEKE